MDQQTQFKTITRIITTTRDPILMEVAMDSNLMVEGSTITGRTTKLLTTMILPLIDCTTTTVGNQDLEEGGSSYLLLKMVSQEVVELLVTLILQDLLSTIW